MKDYLDKIRPYMSKMINSHKTQEEWQIKLTMEINFIFSKYFKETRTIFTVINNVEIMILYETDEKTF